VYCPLKMEVRRPVPNRGPPKVKGKRGTVHSTVPSPATSVRPTTDTDNRNGTTLRRQRRQPKTLPNEQSTDNTREQTRSTGTDTGNKTRSTGTDTGNRTGSVRADTIEQPVYTINNRRVDRRKIRSMRLNKNNISPNSSPRIQYDQESNQSSISNVGIEVIDRSVQKTDPRDGNDRGRTDKSKSRRDSTLQKSSRSNRQRTDSRLGRRDSTVQSRRDSTSRKGSTVRRTDRSRRTERKSRDRRSSTSRSRSRDRRRSRSISRSDSSSEVIVLSSYDSGSDSRELSHSTDDEDSVSGSTDDEDSVSGSTDDEDSVSGSTDDGSRYSDSTEESMSSHRDITLDRLEDELRQKYVRRVPVKLRKDINFERFKRNRKVVERLWHEVRAKYYALFNRGKQYNLHPIMSATYNADITQMSTREVLTHLNEMYIAYRELKSIVDNEFMYTLIKRGLVLMYKLICWAIDSLWGYNTREAMNAILANMDMHDALIRQIKFGEGEGDPFSVTSIPVGIRLMAFVVVNIIIVFVIAKFETISNMLRTLGVTKDKLATGLSNTAGSYANDGSVTMADWMNDAIGLVTMFTGGGSDSTAAPPPPGPAPKQQYPPQQYGNMPQQNPYQYGPIPQQYGPIPQQYSTVHQQYPQQYSTVPQYGGQQSSHQYGGQQSSKLQQSSMDQQSNRERQSVKINHGVSLDDIDDE